MPPPFAPGEGNTGVAAEPIRVFTVGHSGHDPDVFLDLLRQSTLATLVDVRSAPYSRYAPHFNRDRLDALLTGAGITYVWAGDSLGGRPADPACYHDGVVRPGNIDYQAMTRQVWYQDGVQWLVETAAMGVTAIMCSEEDPRRCHRHRLIEPSLRELGVDVVHIRGDGRLETIDSSEEVSAAAPNPQLRLSGFEA